MNIVIFEKHSELFHEVLGLVDSLPHAISRASCIGELVDERSNFDTDLLIINNNSDTSLRSILPAITHLRNPPKVLVVADKLNLSELEFALREGALDYIARVNLPEYIQGLLTRPDGILVDEELSWEGVGERFNIHGACPAIKTCLRTVSRASQSNVSVLIQGETGTGKELFARAIHGLSNRRDGQIVVVDCASLPSSLVESILFGYSRGAFTGATAPTDGLVARAHKGTLFMDEVAELPFDLQKKFLRVLQERRFRPVGATSEVESDFRLLAATSKDLSQMVKDGLFRADLLYRLQSLKLRLPPLRERGDDLVKVTEHLIWKSCRKSSLPSKSCSAEFICALHNHDWPGNIRELENLIDSAVAISGSRTILYPEHLPFYIRIKSAKRSMETVSTPVQIEGDLGISSLATWIDEAMPSYKKFRTNILASFEEQYFKALFDKSQGDVGKAMGIANLSRARLYEFYKKYNLTKSQ